jgi:hypothetical protein
LLAPLVDEAGAAVGGELVAEDAGIGSNAICTLNTGYALGQPPVPPEPAVPADLLEFCSVTALTPSIKRSRSSVRATVDWFFAQPVSANVGTLPAGVLDATELPWPDAGAPEPLEAGAAEALDAGEADALDAGAAAAEPEPFVAAVTIVPVTLEIETFAGSTRPSSWKECAQSKRELTS